MTQTPDWAPFAVAARDQGPEAPRSINTKDGVGDRLRAAAFAEIQARDAFNWAADTFGAEAPASLVAAWRGLALAEEKHLGWLLKRLEELGIDVRERRVSDRLWVSLTGCTNAQDFARYMANAEDRGRRAGERFHEEMRSHDPVSAKIFGQIALEEVEHIALAQKYFPQGTA